MSLYSTWYPGGAYDRRFARKISKKIQLSAEALSPVAGEVFTWKLRGRAANERTRAKVPPCDAMEGGVLIKLVGKFGQ